MYSECFIAYSICKVIITHLYEKMSAKRNFFEAFLQSGNQGSQIDSTETVIDPNQASTSNNGKLNEVITCVAQ